MAQPAALPRVTISGMPGIPRILYSVLLVAVVAGACSSPAPTGATATTTSSAAGATTGVPSNGDFAARVPVGGRHVYLECHGSGRPTIVLQTGYGNAGDIWSTATAHLPAVAPGLAATNRVCVYDRPGTTLSLDDAGNPLPTAQPGRSDQVPMPRTATAVVTEWHDLLATAGVPGPYLFVGHSIGGLFTVLYARVYPDQVAGIVLVDATPPAFASLLPPKSLTLLEASLKAPSSIPGYPYEGYDLDDILRSIDAAPAWRPAPSTLLFAGQPQRVSDPAAQEFLRDVAVVQDQARAQFAASIPGATTSVVSDATHYIHVERPDAVIEAVRAVADKVQ
jgi:pimeloyl-ACP methyl ester carboxylesterase